VLLLELVEVEVLVDVLLDELELWLYDGWHQL
jgi:hypothetical protein